MTPSCTCGHSRTDHLTGRCVNRQMRFDPAVGGTVATQCRCKKFTELEVAPLAAELEPIPAPVKEAEEASGFTSNLVTSSISISEIPAAPAIPETEAEEPKPDGPSRKRQIRKR